MVDVIAISGLFLSLLFFLGIAIIEDHVTALTIYWITILLIVLSGFLCALFLEIQKENEHIRKIQLEHQKAYFMEENKKMISKLYDEISIIEHQTIYHLLYIKSLLQKQDYKNMALFLDKNIQQLSKFKKIINSQNPYFNYCINQKLSELATQNNNMKVTSKMTDYQFEINEAQLQALLDTIDYLFSVSAKNQAFNLGFNQINQLLKIDIYFEKENNRIIDKKHLATFFNPSDYHINVIDKYTQYALVINLS